MANLQPGGLLMSEGGKGSNRRPQQVSDQDMQDAWDRIFLTKKGQETLADILKNPGEPTQAMKELMQLEDLPPTQRRM